MLVVFISAPCSSTRHSPILPGRCRRSGLPQLTLPPRVRWTIVALLSSSIAINLIDRQVLSVLAPILREELRLSATQYAYITASFQLGMMAGQVPVGAFIDRAGLGPGSPPSSSPGRSSVELMRCGGLLGFVALRFLMGLSECGNYTAGIKAIAALFPAATRASAGRVLQRGRAVRLDRRHTAGRVHRHASWLAFRVPHPGAGRPPVADPGWLSSRGRRCGRRRRDRFSRGRDRLRPADSETGRCWASS